MSVVGFLLYPPMFSLSLPLNILLSEPSATVTLKWGRVSYDVDPATKETEWKEYLKVADTNYKHQNIRETKESNSTFSKWLIVQELNLEATDSKATGACRLRKKGGLKEKIRNGV